MVHGGYLVRDVDLARNRDLVHGGYLVRILDLVCNLGMVRDWTALHCKHFARLKHIQGVPTAHQGIADNPLEWNKPRRSLITTAITTARRIISAYAIFSTSATGLRGFLKYGWADFPTAMTAVRISFSGMPSIDLTFAMSRMPMMSVSHPWFFAARTK